MATIKAIDSRSVHLIQSGQVIVDLCSVVKELVENSFDAGATSVEVRFKNQGLDQIEVQDNGTGIAPDSYATVALKHYTSKLTTYADLDKLATFGFRGEALASLCALSKFTITTCMASAVPKGVRLQFESSGKLADQSVVAAQKGTTVSIENLFHNLPVRRRELERNIKREWNKVIALLNQYACIQTGVKFTVSQQPNKGRRLLLFATKGNATTKDNLINVFGAKTLTCLIPLDLKLELEPSMGVLQQLRAGGNGMVTTTEVKILGHVSRPSPGEGRNTPDRQMFYVNGRPCGLPQFAKVFNEVYKTFSPNQSPFIFADIKLDTHLYDVNVSPDKRTIMLHDQSKMLDSLREALVELFESQTPSVPLSQPKMSQQFTPFKKPGIFDKDSSSPMKPSPLARTISLEDNITDSGSVVSMSNENHKVVENEAPVSSLRRLIAKGNTDFVPASDLVDNPSHSGSAMQSSSIGRGTTSSTVHEQDSNISDSVNENENELDNTISKSPQLPVRGDRNFVPLQLSQTPQRVKDFHAMVNEIHGLVESDTAYDSSPNFHLPLDPENSAPSLTSPSQALQQATLPPVSSYVPPRAPKRPAQQIASITIGNETVTTTIGSQAKRHKRSADEQDDTNDSTARMGRKKRQGNAAALPSFGGRLSQMFAAASAKQDASQKVLKATRAGNGGNVDDEVEENGLSNDDGDGEEDESASASDSASWGRPRHCDENEPDPDCNEDTSLFVSDRPSRSRKSVMAERHILRSNSRNSNDDDNEDNSDADADTDIGITPRSRLLAQPLPSPSPPPSPHSSVSTEEIQNLPLDDNASDSDASSSSISASADPSSSKISDAARVKLLLKRAAASATTSSGAGTTAAAAGQIANKRASALAQPASVGKRRDATLTLAQTLRTEGEEQVLALMELFHASLDMTPASFHARRRQREMELVGEEMELRAGKGEEKGNEKEKEKRKSRRAASIGEAEEGIGEDENDKKTPNNNKKEEEEEEKLNSLIVSKSDFERLRVVGQFNLGFIIAVRDASPPPSPPLLPSSSELISPSLPSSSIAAPISAQSTNHLPVTQAQSQQSSQTQLAPAPPHHHESHVFIIDQHAADEKYNFERLSRSTRIAAQRLVRPKPLALTALQEEVVLANLAAFDANGFQLRVVEEPDCEEHEGDDENEGSGIESIGDVQGNSWNDEHGEDISATIGRTRRRQAGARIHLLSLPLSREITFGLSDFEELVALLAESCSSGEQRASSPIVTTTATATATANHSQDGTRDSHQRHIPRPSKVRRMLESRACRTSVMIGTALTRPQMTRLVRQMATLDKPWNCPHGRPTMRHLAGLAAWERRVWEDEVEARGRWL